MASPTGDTDPTRQSSPSRSGPPPLADPQAPPPGSPRQPFEDLLNWAAELDAALSQNQPLDVTQAPADPSLRELDGFAQTPVEGQPGVDIDALPTFTPLEEAEPALVWPERPAPDGTPAPPPAAVPPPPAATAPAAPPPAAATPTPTPVPVPAPAPTAESSELERLVQELESDWFVAEPQASPEPVVTNGQAHTGVIVDDSGELTHAYPEADAAALTPEAAEPYWAPTERRGVSRRTAGIAAAIGIAAVVAIVLVVLALRSSDSGNEAIPAARISFDLPSFPIGSTAAVDTEWALSGKDGKDFSSTSTFVNNTSAPVRVEFQEVIPKSIAADASDITFVGPQPTVIKADPVVQYLVDIPANSEVTRTYEVEVEPLGAERSRLVQWARDLNNGSAQREGTLVSQTTTTTAATLPPPPETEAPPSSRATPTTRRVTPTEPTEPPPTDPPPTEPPPTEPPPTQPPPTTLPPPTTQPPPTTAAP